MFYSSIFMEASMLNINEIQKVIDNKNISDQVIRNWLFEDKRLVSEKIIELLAKHRSLLLQQITMELFAKNAELEKVISNKEI
jgi:Fe-S cluster biosynthesis and repair protein YggX